MGVETAVPAVHSHNTLHEQNQQSASHDKWWDPQNEHNKAAFMDWIESMDFFGCDENAPRKVFQGVDSTLKLASAANKPTDLQRIDYARLHDQLLESLMAEQSKKANDACNMKDLDSSASSFSFGSTLSKSSTLTMNGNNTSLSTQNSSFDSYTQDESVLPNSSKRGHKRPRALRLSKKVMPSISTKNSDDKSMKRKHSSGSAGSISSSVRSFSSARRNSISNSQGKKNKVESDAVRVSLSALNEEEHPPAFAFIHPQCRLQKDKGKGEEAGSNICAKGREHCLLKLEQKMALLTRVAFGEESKNKGTADMKRRPARVSEIFANFTETRSIIELRMGFLSLQYGILLRWDTTRTGKVTLVVLRKMCHESFYTKCKARPVQRNAPTPSNVLKMPAELPSSSLRNVVDGNHAILQRPNGMEVALLEPPYRVSRSEDFAPSLLSVAVQYGTGLSRKSTWTVQLCYDTQIENVLLIWDDEQGCFTPKLGNSLKHEIPINSSLDLPALEIRLFEHRQKRGKSRRCVSHMHVPLMGLDAQPLSQLATPKDVKVVSTHDPDACIAMSVLLQSDYVHWLKQELDARRREEVKAFVWKSPFRLCESSSKQVHYHIDDDDTEEDSIWEWICGVC